MMRKVTDEERDIFRAAADLAIKLREEGRQLDTEFGDSATDRALFQVQYMAGALARFDTLGNR